MREGVARGNSHFASFFIEHNGTVAIDFVRFISHYLLESFVLFMKTTKRRKQATIIAHSECSVVVVVVAVVIIFFSVDVGGSAITNVKNDE